MASRSGIARILLTLSAITAFSSSCLPEASDSASQSAAKAPAAVPAASPPVVHTVALPGFTVSYHQVSSHRVDRTHYEYSFAASLENHGSSSIEAQMRILSAQPGSTIVDDDVAFPVAPAGGTVDGLDTFAIVQDRTTAFLPEFVLFAVCPDSPLCDCRNALFSDEDIIAADDLCAQAVALDATDGEARFFRAITRILRVSEEQQDGPDNGVFTDSVKEMEDQFGLSSSGRSLYNWGATGQRDGNGAVMLPSDSPSGDETQTALADLLLPAIDASIADLQAIDPAVSFLILKADLYSIGGAVGAVLDDSSIEVDYGDAKFVESVLLLLKAAIHHALAVDADFDIDGLSPLSRHIACQTEILDPNPALFGSHEGGSADLPLAAAAIDAAIDAYLAGSDFIQAEVDDQDDDLLTIEPDAVADDAALRVQLADLSDALAGPTCALANGATGFIDEAGIANSLNLKLLPDTLFAQALVDLSIVYDEFFSFRDVMPLFNPYCDVADGAFPDKTFGGALLPSACGSL